MDILKILEESGENLYIEDLDFFETELATASEYGVKYKRQCEEKISQLRKWLASKGKESVADLNLKVHKGGLTVALSDLAPSEANPAWTSLTPEQRLLRDLNALRSDKKYKSKFEKHVITSDEIDANFVDKYYSFFKRWELNVIMANKQMGEEFIEKYFETLDHDIIAQYQLFSENFFMKHFHELDYTIVIEQGQNEWRKKENRSKQLDVFLRLKGVKK